MSRYPAWATWKSDDVMAAVGPLNTYGISAIKNPHPYRVRAFGLSCDFFGLRIGAGERNRTLDLLITSELLYQLSYTGTACRGTRRDCIVMKNRRRRVRTGTGRRQHSI